MDPSSGDSSINNENTNKSIDNVDLKGLSTAFKTVHSRKGKKVVKLLKNRKKTSQSNQVINIETKKQNRIKRKHIESIRKRPSDYDAKDEKVLKNIAKKGVINALKTIYETQSY